MFTNFFYELRKAQVPVSLKEYLALMEAMRQGIADYSVEDFYYLSRTCLVKDERNLDKFDQVFGHVFKGLESTGDGADPVTSEIPRSGCASSPKNTSPRRRSGRSSRSAAGTS